ncbi:MAG: hypothetical protein P1Q69_17410 [Candidatus Thorarchaeota archaeon]|nr:hypothetical protein [Candidatus Thorarchaeota archaeon]
MSEENTTCENYGILGCILSIVSGLVALLFAFGVSNIASTSIEFGETTAWLLGSTGLRFLTPLAWVAITAAFYGTYGKKEDIINNISLLLGIGLIVMSAFSSVFSPVEYAFTCLQNFISSKK